MRVTSGLLCLCNSRLTHLTLESLVLLKKQKLILTHFKEKAESCFLSFLKSHELLSHQMPFTSACGLQAVFRSIETALTSPLTFDFISEKTAAQNINTQEDYNAELFDK